LPKSQAIQTQGNAWANAGQRLGQRRQRLGRQAKQSAGGAQGHHDQGYFDDMNKPVVMSPNPAHRRLDFGGYKKMFHWHAKG